MRRCSSTMTGNPQMRNATKEQTTSVSIRFHTSDNVLAQRELATRTVLELGSFRNSEAHTWAGTAIVDWNANATLKEG